MCSLSQQDVNVNYLYTYVCTFGYSHAVLCCADGGATLLVCPGIANSSESVYIRTFVYHAQQNGFRVAVLNHLGALADVILTSPRIYTYGEIVITCRTSCYMWHRHGLLCRQLVLKTGSF